VTLKLLSISDGTIRKVADVVTDGYENKLDQLAENLKQLYPDHYKNIDDPDQSGGIDWVGDGLITAFEWGIYSVAWSPDSHTLAFAAQIDGLSSDVYLYDVEKDTVQQAEDSLQNVTGIRWSPDGKKIIFENSEPGYGYMGV
jgi:dipeptidyl aminopeptidase/acylaminoacyl peptidase